MEERRLAQDIRVNLNDNKFGIFDIWIDEKGRLELIPHNKVGDLCNHSYVLGLDRYNDYKLFYKQYDEEDTEEE